MNEFYPAHGGNVWQHPVDLDFSININPLGMPAQASNAAMRGVMLAGHCYPDPSCLELRRRLATLHGLVPGQILVGNGASELILALCQLAREGTVLVQEPTFEEYAACALRAGAGVRSLPARRDFRLSEDFCRAITAQVSLAFLCSPNNPTGLLIPRRDLLRIARRCEETGTWLCVDECFLPFTEREREQTMLGELRHFPHLLVLRAFTKVYAMPGLRCGVLYCADLRAAELVRRHLSTWNVSLPAQMAAAEAIGAGRDAYLKRTRQVISRGRGQLSRQLQEQGLVRWLVPGESDYLFFGAREDLQARLLEQGILIRSCASWPGCPADSFRICVRLGMENEELIRRWRRIR